MNHDSSEALWVYESMLIAFFYLESLFIHGESVSFRGVGIGPILQ